MLIKPLVPLLLCLVTMASAQSTPPAPASGPTMKQTIDFLKDMIEKQGPAQVVSSRDPNEQREVFISLTFKEPCSLILKSYRKEPSLFYGNTSIVDLARSEPTSVAIKPRQDSSKPVYFVVIEHAYREVLSSDPMDDKPATPVPPSAEPLAGTVTANSGSTITFVALDGHLMSYTPAKKAKLTTNVTGQPDSKAAIGDFAVGNLIVVNANSAINSPQSAPPKGFDSVSVAVTADQETANRMAKALIHALVLCHKDDKPSPF